MCAAEGVGLVRSLPRPLGRPEWLAFLHQVSKQAWGSGRLASPRPSGALRQWLPVEWGFTLSGSTAPTQVSSPHLPGPPQPCIRLCKGLKLGCSAQGMCWAGDVPQYPRPQGHHTSAPDS